MMSAEEEIGKALSILKKNTVILSQVFREAYHKYKKGALLLYTSSVIKNLMPTISDYRTAEDILLLFDDPNSKAELSKIIKEYSPHLDGVLVLITSVDNATWFVTQKLENFNSVKS